jgi:hypothetical protein
MKLTRRNTFRTLAATGIAAGAALFGIRKTEAAPAADKDFGDITFEELTHEYQQLPYEDLVKHYKAAKEALLRDLARTLNRGR